MDIVGLADRIGARHSRDLGINHRRRGKEPGAGFAEGLEQRAVVELTDHRGRQPVGVEPVIQPSSERRMLGW